MSLGYAFAWMLAGILGQFVARMATLEEHGKVPTPWEYISKHPYRCMSLLLGSAFSIVLLRELEQLTEATAIFTGYFCQDVADRARVYMQSRVGPKAPS